MEKRRNNMSVKDGKDYLYLIWKSEQTRKQYIIGQLTKNGQYEFQYSEEVQSAIADGFKPLLCFPDLTEPLPAKAGRFGLLLKQPKAVSALIFSLVPYFYPISKLSDLFFSCKS